MPRIWLSNDTSDVSGYKIAYVDMRPPGSTALSTSVTNTTGSGDNIAATDTAGGTALKWITKPLLAAATLVTKVQCNIWAKESNASANAGVGIQLVNYTAAAEDQTFLDSNDTVECGTSAAAMRWTTVAATSQAFAAGDRLVVKLQAVAVGTMGASQTVTIDYGGPTAGADGDTYLDIIESFRVNESQFGSGATPYLNVAPGRLTGMIDEIQRGIDMGYYSSSATVRSVLDLLTYERNLLCPRTAQTTPT